MLLGLRAACVFSHSKELSTVTEKYRSGLSHPFLVMGPGPLELGKLAAFRLKLGKSILSICM